MFKEWDSFYLLMGSAAGALIGLLFVVATLTTNLGRDRVTRGTQLYMTPTVFHLAVVLMLSALTAVPGLKAWAAGLLVGTLAVGGVAYAVFVIVRIAFAKDASPTHWSDVWFYGVAAGAAYVGLLVAAVALGAEALFGSYMLAGALVALLLISIRNAWDLVTFLAPEASEAKRAAKDE